MLKEELLFYVSPSVELIDIEFEKSILQDSQSSTVDSLDTDNFDW